MEGRSAPPQLNWRLWLWWTVATVAAFIPFYFLPTLPPARDLFPREAWGLDFLYMAAMGAGSGAILGVAQWLVLRRYLQRAWTWILACIVGEAVGTIAAWAIMRGLAVPALAWAQAGLHSGEVVFGGAYGVTLYGVIGIAQWLTLRRQVRRAGWWIVASVALGIFANPLISGSGWTSVGTILGFLVPGLVLVLLIGPRRPACALPAEGSPGDVPSR
jgi:hypothetical protein